MRNIAMTLMDARHALRSLLVQAVLFVLLSLGLVVSAAQAQGSPLNDTGITWSANAALLGQVSSTCKSTDTAGQDCGYGRDAAAAAGMLPKIGGASSLNQGIANGFDFTKISNSGSPLPAGAALGSGPDDWACTLDNVTGLIWEMKTTDGGLRDRKWMHTMSEDNYLQCYDPHAAGCTVSSYNAAINAQGLCGANDWRMPSVNELVSIVDFGRISPAIDPTYFPNTLPPAQPGYVYYYWSATPDAGKPGSAWLINPVVGSAVSGWESVAPGLVRVVRGGQ